MGEWQPIATVPASETRRGIKRLLVWVANGGDDRKGTIAFGYAYRDRDGKAVSLAIGFSGDWLITHWMPEPDAPRPSMVPS